MHLQLLLKILLLVVDEKERTFKNYTLLIIRCIVGFAFSIWGIMASGAEVVMYGFILLLLGIPIYGFMKLKTRKNDTTLN